MSGPVICHWVALSLSNLPKSPPRPLTTPLSHIALCNLPPLCLLPPLSRFPTLRPTLLPLLGVGGIRNHRNRRQLVLGWNTKPPRAERAGRVGKVGGDWDKRKHERGLNPNPSQFLPALPNLSPLFGSFPLRPTLLPLLVLGWNTKPPKPPMGKGGKSGKRSGKPETRAGS